MNKRIIKWSPRSIIVRERAHKLINVWERIAPHKSICVSLMFRYQSTIIIATSSTHFFTQLPFDRSRKSTRVRGESVCAEWEKKAIKFSTGFRGKKERANDIHDWISHLWMKFSFSIESHFSKCVDCLSHFLLSCGKSSFRSQ